MKHHDVKPIFGKSHLEGRKAEQIGMSMFDEGDMQGHGTCAVGFGFSFFFGSTSRMVSKVVLSSVATSVSLPLGATLHLSFAFVAFGRETGDRFDILALK